MKQLILILILLFFSIALSVGDTQAADMKPLQKTEPNVQIINGQRFFSLQNVRRFNGDANSPRALSVMHHPRNLAPNITPSSRGRTNFTPAATGATPATSAAGKDSNPVLSIFAPDDKSASPATR